MPRSTPCARPTGLVLLLAALAAAPASANLLTNGSFEAVQITGEPWFLRSPTSTPGWVQTGDGVDLVHNNYFQGPPLPVLVDAADGVQFLDMNQDGSLGGIEQTVAVVAGTPYLLTLDATAWVENARGGSIGYELRDGATVLASGSFLDPDGGLWVTRSLQATATSNQLTVAIFATFSTQAGMGVDNVVLTAVPIPAGAWLLASALGSLGLARRYRRPGGRARLQDQGR